MIDSREISDLIGEVYRDLTAEHMHAGRMCETCRALNLLQVRFAKYAEEQQRRFETKLREKGLLFDFDESTCPGHVAHSLNPKVCGRCGVHIDELAEYNGGDTPPIP